MSRFRRTGSLLVAIGGSLGIALCVAAIVGASLLAARLRGINALAHDGIERSVSTVRAQVLRAQQRVVESKITSEDVHQQLADWSRHAATKRAAEKLDVQAKAEQLSLSLADVDRYLELGQSLADSIHDTLELAAELGIRSERASASPIAQHLAETRAQLHQATAALAEIRRRVDEVADTGPLGERWQAVIQFALRVVATVGEVDDRLAAVAEKLRELQAWAEGSEIKVRRWILGGQIAATAILAWLALGQASLCVHGWRVWRRPSEVSAAW
jgi:hypothetical protein